jgi:uncharacterized membrane protein
MTQKNFRLLKRLRSKPLPKRTITIVLLGLMTLVLYASWWWQEARMTSPWLLFSFLIAMLYSCIQIIGSWILYIAAHYIDKRRL